MYAEKITKVADEIEEIRKELYSKKYVDSDEIREKIDNILFGMQSKLRYNIATILKDYEELKEMDSKKCIKYKRGSICRVICRTYSNNEAVMSNANKVSRCPYCGNELIETEYEEDIKSSYFPRITLSMVEKIAQAIGYTPDKLENNCFIYSGNFYLVPLSDDEDLKYLETVGFAVSKKHSNCIEYSVTKKGLKYLEHRNKILLIDGTTSKNL